MGLTKRFGDVVAVDSPDLHVQGGEVFGSLGPNGAGKSTTIDMLLDYVRPTEGTATVLGLDVHEKSEDLRKHIGRPPAVVAAIGYVVFGWRFGETDGVIPFVLGAVCVSIAVGWEVYQRIS